MTGDHKRHGVHGVSSSHRAIGMWTVDLSGDVEIRTCFAIWNAKHRLQGFALERRKESPVNGDGEGGTFITQVFAQFFCIRSNLFLIRLDGSLEACEKRIKFRLGRCPFNGDQTQVGGGEAEISKRSPVQFTDVNRGYILCFHLVDMIIVHFAFLLIVVQS